MGEKLISQPFKSDSKNYSGPNPLQRCLYNENILAIVGSQFLRGKNFSFIMFEFFLFQCIEKTMDTLASQEIL